MELWKDVQRDKWFTLDSTAGQHYECDMYGQPLRRFRVYDTGHASPRDRSPDYHPSIPPIDSNYFPQPRTRLHRQVRGVLSVSPTQVF